MEAITFGRRCPEKEKNLFIGLRPLRLSEGMRVFLPPFSLSADSEKEERGRRKDNKTNFFTL